MIRKQNIIVVSLFITAVLIFAAAGFLNREKQFNYKEHLQDTVFTVGKKEITLKEEIFYIMAVEEYVDGMAENYDSGNTSAIWNLHFSAGLSSNYLRDMAKDVASETCIYDYVMSEEAEKAGFSLSDEQIKNMKAEADGQFENLDGKTAEVSEWTEKEYEELMLRHELVREYAHKLAESADLSGCSDSPEKELSYDGDYYKNEIRKKYNVVINTELWDKIDVGSITIQK